jgi:hypothetical protein
MGIVGIVQKRMGEKLPILFCEKSRGQLPAKKMPGPWFRKNPGQKMYKNTPKMYKDSFKKHLTDFKVYDIMNTERKKKGEM